MQMKTTVKGIEFDVEVTPDGRFVTGFNGESYEANQLSTLKWELKNAITLTRLEVPFMTSAGQAGGIIRGYHAGRKEVLVTWPSGVKGSVSTYHPVYRVGELSEQEAQELQALLNEQQEIAQRIEQFKGRTIEIEEILQEAVQRQHGPEQAQEIESYKYQRQREEAMSQQPT